MHLTPRERSLVAAFLSLIRQDEWEAAARFADLDVTEQADLVATLDDALQRLRILALPVEGTKDDRRFTPYQNTKRRKNP